MSEVKRYNLHPVFLLHHRKLFQISQLAETLKHLQMFRSKDSLCYWTAEGTRDPWPTPIFQIKQDGESQPKSTLSSSARDTDAIKWCKNKKQSCSHRSGWNTSLAAMGGEEKVGTYLGSFWMLSMDGDLAKVPSGGRAGPDLLYGDSTEGQYCSCL